MLYCSLVQEFQNQGVPPPTLPVLTAGDVVVDPGHGDLCVAYGVVVVVVHHAFNPMMHLGETTAGQDADVLDADWFKTM